MDHYIRSRSNPRIQRQHHKYWEMGMIGGRMEHLADIVKLIRAMRKPRHKKLRSFYVKDDFMVGYETITGRAQDGSLIRFTRQGLKHIKERAIALAADAVYMLHYCPAEDSAPPPIAGDLAAFYRETICGLRAHIIVYPESFSFISPGGHYILRVLPDKPKKINKSNKPRSSLLPRGSRIKKLPALSAWVTALEGREHYAVVSINERNTSTDPCWMSLSNIQHRETWRICHGSRTLA